MAHRHQEFHSETPLTPPIEWNTYQRIHPVDPAPLFPYTTQQAQFFINFVNGVDQMLVYAIHRTPQSSIVAAVASANSIEKQRDAIAVGVAGLLRRPDVSVVAPLYGTVPMLRDIWAHCAPDGHSRIYPVIVKSTQGTTFRDITVVHGKLPPVQAARHKPDDYLPTRIVVEDVVDGNHVLSRLIEKMSGEHITDAASMVAACQRHNIVIAVQVSKNDEVLAGLQQAVEPAQTRWQHLQGYFVNQIVSAPGWWLMGEGMDTGISVAKVLARMNKPSLMQHPAVSALFTDAVINSEFRIGSTIQGLIGLRGTYDQLIDVVIGCLQYQLTDNVTTWNALHAHG